MSYLKDFLTQIHNRDFHKFLVLWEEYCTSDTVETEELSQLLKVLKASEMARHFGQIVETALPLWKTIADEKESYEIIRLLIDLQTTNSPALAEVVMEVLQKYHGQDPKYNEKLRLAGLRDKDNFQGAISKYDLLSHMAKGNTVFHGGGWGTGEITDVSLVREHMVVEFENVSGRKDISFANAFKTLIPLPSTHFLARRFADPDLLEKEGREDPVKLIKMLLHDIGPRSAAEIKDELCELVIPEKDWTKWWQGTRAKLKKDPMVETPDALKEPFYLRKAELSAEDRLVTVMQDKSSINEFILATYNFLRDTPGALKKAESKEALQTKLLEKSSEPNLTDEQRIQLYFMLEQYFGYQFPENRIAEIIRSKESIDSFIQNIEIVAFKKRVLIAIKEQRKDWINLFLSLLFVIPQAQLRDYILKELNRGEQKELLEARLRDLLHSPAKAPEMFVWYFQKLIGEKESIPYQSKEGKEVFFEALFVLIHALEGRSEYRDLIKKMYNMITEKRYALVRQLLQGTPIEYVKEFLLLASKCQSFGDHDMQILRSLAEVVHPELSVAKPRRGGSGDEEEQIWTTEEGYLKVQERITQIGTVEVVENAREIEAARALGDLRENSEFKFAQERRARLQSELKTLSDQLKRARILSPDDIHADEVGIGNLVEIEDSKGNLIRYTLLGPWDADPDQNILSFNSKLAQAMIGKQRGESFDFKDEHFEVKKIGSYIAQDI